MSALDFQRSLELALDKANKQIEKLEGELAEARANPEYAQGTLGKMRKDILDLRFQLAQTRSLLAARTEALQGFCYCEKLHPDTGGRCEACSAIASTGTEELAAIRGAIDELAEQSCDCEEVNYKVLTCGRCEALAALTKYFGGGE